MNRENREGWGDEQAEQGGMGDEQRTGRDGGMNRQKREGRGDEQAEQGETGDEQREQGGTRG